MEIIGSSSSTVVGKFILFPRTSVSKVCELQESVVGAVEEVLKLIEIGNRLRYALNNLFVG